MSVIKRMRRQKAVWWKRSASPDHYGSYSYDLPVEISCRWDDSGTEFRNKDGQTEVSAATVYPDRVMAPGDQLRKGEMESDTPDDPKQSTSTFEIKRFDETPNFRATEILYTAYLT